MNGPRQHLINPGPVDDIRQDNAHRVGAPNHHQNTGSGGTTMVGTIHPADHGPDVGTARFVRDRLAGQTHRFVTAGPGGLTVHVNDLAELVAEIVAEYTDHLTAERDALAEDLAWELNATRQEVA